jgi:L-asparaginase
MTGGTFDKEYDEIKGELAFRDTHFHEILKRIRCTVPLALEMNQLIDSLHMKDENRKKILDSCNNAEENRIVIIHGTDSMIETASLLGKARFNKSIVLTGAMVPYTVAYSDAMFNLGCAICAVQLLQPGVYIAMNGRIFTWDNVRKNKKKGVFESIK